MKESENYFTNYSNIRHYTCKIRYTFKIPELLYQHTKANESHPYVVKSGFLCSLQSTFSLILCVFLSVPLKEQC